MKYKASLTAMGQKCSATGETAIEAITNLKPKNVKAKGILTVEHDGITRERILMPHIASRLFNMVGLNREVALKNMGILFSGF